MNVSASRAARDDGLGLHWPTCRCRSLTGLGPERRWPWPRDRARLSGFESGWVGPSSTAPRTRSWTPRAVHDKYKGSITCSATVAKNREPRVVVVVLRASLVDGMMQMQTLRRAVRLLVAAVAVSNVVLVNGMYEDQVSTVALDPVNPVPPPPLLSPCLPPWPIGAAASLDGASQRHPMPSSYQVGQTDWKLEHIGTPTWCVRLRNSRPFLPRRQRHDAARARAHAHAAARSLRPPPP